MINRKSIAFAEVNLDYDEKLFAEEFDQHILPFAEPFVPVHTQWTLMPELNKHWNIIPTELFDKYHKIIADGGTDFNGMTHYWKAVNLMKHESGPEDGVGAGWRSMVRHYPTVLKNQFKELNIVRWIQSNLPAERIVGIHCVSVEQGEFATMHRDGYWHKDSPNPALNNGFFNEGFVVVCLNISNGGVPLLWAMDHEKDRPLALDAKCYVGNDYFIHGVPLTTSRRRQVRVSFVPSDDFYTLINTNSIISVPDNYQYY